MIDNRIEHTHFARQGPSTTGVPPHSGTPFNSGAGHWSTPRYAPRWQGCSHHPTDPQGKATHKREIEAMTASLRLGEAAERLGCSTWMVRKLITDGELKAYKHGGNTSPWIIPETSITAYEQEHLNHED